METKYIDVINYKRDNANFENTCHVEQTPLSKAFFASNNVDLLLSTLRKTVYLYCEQKIGKGIDIGEYTQDRKELISVMRTVLAYYRRTIKESDSLHENLKFLDRETLDHLTPKIAGKAIQQIRFLRDIDHPMTYNPIPIPIVTNFKQRELELKTYYNSCRKPKQLIDDASVDKLVHVNKKIQPEQKIYNIRDPEDDYSYIEQPYKKKVNVDLSNFDVNTKDLITKKDNAQTSNKSNAPKKYQETFDRNLKKYNTKRDHMRWFRDR